MKHFSYVPSLLAMLFLLSGQSHTQEIVHDAEYYILEAQNGEVWKVGRPGT